MTDAIYVVGPEGNLAPVQRTPYALEDDLQKLIADHPELLPGDQISPESPRRWRLIRREAGVGAAAGSARWSLDHLFVDQDAIPTLVEAKRGGNPEARREVVAQLLEYAANGTLYWPIDQIRSWFEEQHEGSDAAAASIASLLEVAAADEEAYESFWARFETNLRDRRIRLIFVADAIPSELRTLVEFLNEQMSRVEVLAVEVVQYAGNGRQMLRPQLVGQTATARARKDGPGRAPSRAVPWTEDEILDLLGAEGGLGRERGEQILAWAHARGDLVVSGNTGLTYRMLHCRLRLGPNRLVTMCSMYSTIKYLLEIPFSVICGLAPFTDPAERAALHASLRPLTRMTKGNPAEESYAYADADHMRSVDDLYALLALVDGCIDRVKSRHSSHLGSSPS